MRGAKGRETGAYTDVREDFEPLSNNADRPRSSFAAACYGAERQRRPGGCARAGQARNERRVNRYRDAPIN